MGEGKVTCRICQEWHEGVSHLLFFKSLGGWSQTINGSSCLLSKIWVPAQASFPGLLLIRSTKRCSCTVTLCWIQRQFSVALAKLGQTKKTANGIVCLLRATERILLQNSTEVGIPVKNAGCLFAKSEMNRLICIILVMELGVLEVDVVLLSSQYKVTESCMVMVSIASNGK